jgi:hypothetical protein
MISENLKNKAFAALEPVLMEIMAQPEAPAFSVAEERFTKAVLPVVRAEGLPDTVAAYLAASFMRMVEAIMEANQVKAALHAIGINPDDCQIIGIGRVQTPPRRTFAEQAAPSLN